MSLPGTSASQPYQSAARHPEASAECTLEPCACRASLRLCLSLSSLWVPLMCSLHHRLRRLRRLRACAWSRAFAASSAAESTLRWFCAPLSALRSAEPHGPSENLLLLDAHRLTDVADRVLWLVTENASTAKSLRKLTYQTYP